jgi:hypothetical protein
MWKHMLMTNYTKKLAIDSLHAMFIQDNGQFYWLMELA